jgi:GTP cyclohydrolase IA
MALHHLPDELHPTAAPDAGPDNTRLEELVHELLGHIGEDPQRDGLTSTPRRVATAWRDLTAGYHMNVDELLNDALFDVAYDEMVIVKDIEIFSLCEHHLLPFFGKMHIAYIPKNKVIGLSKVARVADMFAKRLQVQERLTHQVAETIQKAVDPIGVGVVCEARHLCMMMRGVEKQHSATITSSMLGDFRDNPKTREEFLSLVGRRSNGV